MSLSKQLAKHLRDVHFGGNWTCVNLKDTLSELTWQQAITKVYSFNTIATLVNHIHYYAEVQIRVLRGEPLDAKDELSFAHPPINNQQDWENILNKMWDDAETLANLIEQLPDRALWEHFTDEKYGTWYRNLQGNIEHMHYHLGQIVIIKKMLQSDK